MKTRTILALVLAAALGASARADLIGDNITVAHYFPSHDSFGLYETHTVVVSAGTGDVVPVIGAYYVNPEANSILVDFEYDATFSTAAFNGLVVSNIDSLITSVTVSTNFVGWDLSRLSFDGSSISANWQGLAIDHETYFNISVNQSVPDSGSILAVLGCSLLGLAGLRRKLARA